MNVILSMDSRTLNAVRRVEPYENRIRDFLERNTPVDLRRTCMHAFTRLL